MNKTKKPGKNRKTKTWVIVTAILLVLMITVTTLGATTFRSILDTVLGGKTPIMASGSDAIYKSDYASKQEAKNAGDAINLEIAKEGFVLLVNNNGALPLTSAERKVSVFGKNSTNLVLSGSGSRTSDTCVG